jgi:hypothetical protein
MADEIMTIKVFTKDRVWLEKLYGQPTHVAFHKVRNLCPHPEESRTYVSAEVPYGAEALNQTAPILTIHGFHCSACRKYIFLDVVGEE